MFLMVNHWHTLRNSKQDLVEELRTFPTKKKEFIFFKKRGENTKNTCIRVFDVFKVETPVVTFV